MRAILLAAGKGERLKDFSKEVPKTMLKVQGEIILEHNIMWLRQYGVNDIYINLHYLPGIIQNYFGDGKRWDVQIRYSYESELLGTAGAVRKIASELFKNKVENEEFLVIYGDNFYPLHYDLKEFIHFHSVKKSLITIGLYKKESEISKSGIVIMNSNNKIMQFFEKPSFEISKQYTNEAWINTGLYILNFKVVDYMLEGFSDFGKDIFPKLLGQGIQMYGYAFSDELIAIDTVELYDKVR